MSTMFCFNGMFKPYIENSNLKMPDDFDNYNPNEYTHFHVFLLTHLCRYIDVAYLEENANIIANIPNEQIMYVTLDELMNLGISFGYGDLV